MGYYTDFELSINAGEEIKKEVAQRIFREFNKRIGCFFSSAEEIKDGSMHYANAKWYNWKKDMSEISELFPEIEFFLCGNGEDNSDIWEATAENGVVRKRKAELVFGEWYTVDV